MEQLRSVLGWVAAMCGSTSRNGTEAAFPERSLDLRRPIYVLCGHLGSWRRADRTELDGTPPGVGDVAGAVGVDAVLLIDVVCVVPHRGGSERWVVQPDDAWCRVRPPVGRSRPHGWKLHVSATPLSAPLVLARAAEVLVRHGCAFKFATDLARVAELVGVWYARGSAGKFITAYPDDDDQFRAEAEELDRATDGLAGPRILSDKPVRESSLVHYRYGAFSDEAVFTDDGMFESRLVGPDGSVVVRHRNQVCSWCARSPTSRAAPDGISRYEVVLKARIR
jgi:hypothetical protein